MNIYQLIPAQYRNAEKDFVRFRFRVTRFLRSHRTKVISYKGFPSSPSDWLVIAERLKARKMGKTFMCIKRMGTAGWLSLQPDLFATTEADYYADRFGLYLLRRVPGKGLCGVSQLPFLQLWYGLSPKGRTGAFRFHDEEDAIEALSMWDGKSDPGGSWTRHVGKGFVYHRSPGHPLHGLYEIPGRDYYAKGRRTVNAKRIWRQLNR